MNVRTGGVRFRRGPWKTGGRQYPAGWPFGFLLPGTGLSSSAYVTIPKDRRALGRERVPFWQVINYAPGALVSLDDQILPVGNFVALAFVGSSEQGPASYQTQHFQVVDEQGQGFRFARVGVVESNIMGTANRPFIFRRPYPMPDLLSLLNRMANRATVSQNVQLCVYGVREYVL